MTCLLGDFLAGARGWLGESGVWGLGSGVCSGLFFLFLSEMLREGSSREEMGFVMGL